MSESTLPVILSIPHGGLAVPDELNGRLAITETDVYNECDLWIDILFDFTSMDSATAIPVKPLARVSTPIARALVDVNRESSDLANPDGPVKTFSSYGRRVCVEPLSNAEKQLLIRAYWEPFHSDLERALVDHSSNARLFLDCHNMAQTGPSAYQDPGAPRPLICLSNLGTETGSPRGSALTSCTQSLITEAAAIAEETFADLSLLEPLDGPPPPIVSINRPYPGGYILRKYTEYQRDHSGPPGMMIEINRGLYVGHQTADTQVQPPNHERIVAVRDRLSEWLSQVLDL